MQLWVYVMVPLNLHQLHKMATGIISNQKLANDYAVFVLLSFLLFISNKNLMVINMSYNGF